MSDDRISKLSQRFKQHAVGRPPTATRNRERRTFYLDGDLVGRLDKAYRDFNHSLYPNRVNKSAFLETLLEYGIDHIEDLRPLLLASQETDSGDREGD